MLIYRSVFSFSKIAPLKRYGFEPETIPKIPQYDFPTRAYVEGEEQIPKQDIYNYLQFKKKQFPRCRYFAYEHKGQIYHVFDSARFPFGRMMAKIATFIRGKNTPLYKNNLVNQGQIAVIVNAQDPLFTGKKLRTKQLIYHTGFVGHLKREPYRDLLKRRPELLYYHTLNKFMPKNKLSKQYFNNLYVFRGKTHNFQFLPQFAPDKNIYEGLPETNLLQLVAQNPDVKLAAQTDPGLAKQIFGKDFEKTDLFQQKQVDMVPAITKSAILKLQAKEKRMKQRYRIVRAMKKKKVVDEDPGLQYFSSQSQIKKSPHYELLKKEEIDEDEQQVVKFIYPRKDAADTKSTDKKETPDKGNPKKK